MDSFDFACVDLTADDWMGFMPGVNEPEIQSTNLFYGAGAEDYQPSVPRTVAVQPPTGILPTLTEFDGPYRFSVNLEEGTANKSWLYSSILNMVFIKMNNVLMMEFKVDRSEGLFVRALLTFMKSDFANLPVQRCRLHAVEDDLNHQAHTTEDGREVCRCSHFNQVGHVIQSQSKDSIYCFDGQSGRHSVLVPLPSPQNGSDFVNLAFKFTCKNSCQSGMQRRPVQIIFTLEDSNHQVYGRSVVPVKICSCPKRDKMKEEDTRKRKSMEKADIKVTVKKERIDEPKPQVAETEKSTKEVKLKTALLKVKSALDGIMESINVLNEALVSDLSALTSKND